MNDTMWMSLRYALIGAGMFFAGRGVLTADQVAPLVETTINSLSALMAAVGTAVWGVYIRWNTKTVLADTGARPDVPTVSAGTGAVEAAKTD